MLIRLLFLVFCVGLAGCKGGADDPPELSDYTCVACGVYDPIIEQRNEQAISSRCDKRESVLNRGTTCQVGNVHYSQLITTFEDCEAPPSCVEDPGEGFGGSSGFGWDYECHICGGDAEIDRAHDGGAEDSGCSNTGILRDVGMQCPGGNAAVVVGLSDCDEVPACAAE